MPTIRAATSPDEMVDVTAAIDAQPVSAFQVRVLLLCAAVLLADGFDTQAIAFVAPSLAQEWSVSRAALGPVLSAGLFGLMLGAMLLGPLADRVGRRRIIVASTLCFALGTLATAFAQTLDQMLVLRVLTGLGLGGAMPNAVALTAEFSPRRRRTVMVMLMFCGFSLGGALGAGLAAWLIPVLGWRAVFVVGGVAPLLLVPLLLRMLPESVRYLALNAADPARVAALMTRISPAPRYPPGTRFGVAEPPPRGLPVAALFAHGRHAATLALWLVFFMSLLTLYFLTAWIPTVVNQLGASISVAAIAGGVFQVGGIAGAVSLGWCIERFGASRVLALTYLLATMCIGAIGGFGQNLPMVMVAIFGAGFGIVGAQIGANAFAATFYPTAARATGVGWALGMGRIGSIVGPLLGGVVLGLHWSLPAIFLLGALPALIAALAALALGRLQRHIQVV